ncbi:MAG: barstar family protein [Myxococcales bacterium]
MTTSLPLAYPPQSTNQWRSLDEAGRWLWLQLAMERFVGTDRLCEPSCVPGREAVIDGTAIDNLLGFYCAMGEAVNGPGGYFGRSMLAFDDCLFGGYGLEFPYTIVWKDSGQSRLALGAPCLVKYLDDSSRHPPPIVEEGKAWRDETRELALAGRRTMFDEIVETISSVPSRNGQGRLRAVRNDAVTLILE